MCSWAVRCVGRCEGRAKTLAPQGPAVVIHFPGLNAIECLYVGPESDCHPGLTMGFLDNLPNRDGAHDTAQAAETAFQATIDAGRLFHDSAKGSQRLRDRRSDGSSRRPGNDKPSRSRATQRYRSAPNADGSVSVGGISRTNLNYLLAQPDSIYACLHIPSCRLLVRYAIDVFLDYGAADHHGAVRIRLPSVSPKNSMKPSSGPCTPGFCPLAGLDVIGDCNGR